MFIPTAEHDDLMSDMRENPVYPAMVRTIYDAARILKLQTIAEWVEDEATLQSLKSIGIDYAQ
ncbi:MAG: EAL domain-containing protein [Gammaproteobacteria bacterium]|nr:MAG: EAL domain-containing protein [Gammaproteobacteria bacterium]UCH38500.1 MAG: EAL domain-containing protein [Gammaproteobacteria bacterium]